MSTPKSIMVSKFASITTMLQGQGSRCTRSAV